MKLTDTPLHIRYAEVSGWNPESQSFAHIHYYGLVKPIGVKVFGGQLRAMKFLENFISTVHRDEKG